MKPSPVINVANTPPSAAKPASGASSDQSFGQVLAQQVNAPDSSSAAKAGGNTPATAPAAAAANSNTQSNSSTGDSSTAVGGKTIKSKHNQDDANTSVQPAADPNALAGSAQLLSLVSSVQQAAADAVTGADSAAATLAAAVSNTTSTAQAALANFQSAASKGASAIKTAVEDAASDFAQDIKATVPQSAGRMAQDLTPDNTAPDTATAGASTTAQTASPLSLDSQNAVPGQPAEAIAATAQTNVQSDIASLVQAAAKSADNIRDTMATAAAAPAMINNTQLNAVASQMSGAGEKLTPQVGSPGWDQALGQKVVWMVAGGQQSASLTLNPPDLGPMQVVLNVTNSHASATFTAAQPEVRQALEAALPKLREMLGDAGIQLGQASVNAGHAQQQQNFANQASSRSSGGERGIDAIDGTPAAPALAAGKVSSGIGLVDTFA